MRKEDFFEVLGELDSDIVKEAKTLIKRKTNWKIWGVMAACLAVVAALGIGLLQSGLFGKSTDTVTLDNGDKIVFVKSNTGLSSFCLAYDASQRQLTEEETHSLFPGLPITAHAIYMTSYLNVVYDPPELIGVKGNIGNVKITISVSNIQLSDVVIIGNEKSTKVNGTSVTAGYFITRPNSNGKRTVIYYATIEFGSSQVYIESSGAAEDRETIKNEVAAMIQAFIKNGEPDLSQIN